MMKNKILALYLGFLPLLATAQKVRPYTPILPVSSKLHLYINIKTSIIIRMPGIISAFPPTLSM